MGRPRQNIVLKPSLTARRKNHLQSKLILNNEAQELAKYQIDGFLDQSFIYKKFSHYSRVSIKTALKNLNYRFLSSASFVTYFLYFKKKFNIREITRLLGSDRSTIKHRIARLKELKDEISHLYD